MDVDKDDDVEAVDVLELGGWSSFFSSSFFFSSFSRLLFLVRLTLVSSSKKGRPKFKASDASNDETINTAPIAIISDNLFVRNLRTCSYFDFLFRRLKHYQVTSRAENRENLLTSIFAKHNLEVAGPEARH